jgi:fatty-acyl-CoA synthase
MNQRGIPVHSFYRSLPDALFAAPPDKPFVTIWRNEDDIESLTFGEFKRRALIQAEFLKCHGVGAGDTVILVMPQGIPLMTAFVGAMILGAVPTILAYPNFKIEPTKYRFGLTGVSANLNARLIVVDRDFPDELLKHLRADGQTQIVKGNDDLALAANDDIHEIMPDRLAFIQHSAGTTGLQKGVALSHMAVLKQLSYLATAIQLDPQDRIYSWLPLYHDMGLIACFMLPLVCHTPVIMQSPIDWILQPTTMLELIQTYRCSLAWIPNFTLQFLARRVRPEDRSRLDLSTLRALINCSEPIRASSMTEFLAAFGNCGLRTNVLQSCYAMAETVFAVTQSNVTAAGIKRLWIDGNSFRKQKVALPVSNDAPGAICMVSSGQCLPDTHIRIVSSEAKNLPPGGIGEIVIRCSTMLEGYYNRPDLTAKALRGGWYWSGDLGFMLDDELYVVGRKKDLIIVAGENIYPQDIEELVSDHPSIYDGRVVAFGHYNPARGTEEVIVVAEVRHERDLQTAEMIERQLKSAITTELQVGIGAIYLKPPRWIVKSTAGKPARSTTRKKLLSEHAELRFEGDFSSCRSTPKDR